MNQTPREAASGDAGQAPGPGTLGRPGAPGRRNGKERGIADWLRHQIQVGGFAPGARLPSRATLKARFAASSVTVQHAFDQLRAEGFIHARGARGTFVADRLPHVSNYGLVLPEVITSYSDGPLRLFHRNLYLEANRMRQGGDAHLCIYQGVHRDRQSGQAHAVEQAVRRQTLAGLILALPWSSEHSSLQQAWLDTQTPVVAFSASEHAPAGTVVLRCLPTQWVERALSHVTAMGRRRVAMLDISPHGALPGYFDRAVESHGAQTRRWWKQFVHVEMTDVAGNVAQLLMRSSDRPDALLIPDDSLVEPATRGLHEMGVRVPEDVAIVGHCNYPNVTPSPLPIDRLGYDTGEVIGEAMGLIDTWRRGEQVPPATHIEPVFEFEQSRHPTQRLTAH